MGAATSRVAVTGPGYERGWDSRFRSGHSQGRADEHQVSVQLTFTPCGVRIREPVGPSYMKERADSATP